MHPIIEKNSRGIFFVDNDTFIIYIGETSYHLFHLALLYVIAI